MHGQRPPGVLLRGTWLLLARGGWVVIATLTLGLVIPGFVVLFRDPGLLDQPQLEQAVAQMGSRSGS
jgi:hypothetical protein